MFPQPTISKPMSAHSIHSLLDLLPDLLRGRASLTIHIAQITIPAQAHNIHNQDPMMQRHICKINRLHRGPEDPVLLERLDIRALQARFGALALHVRHAAQEKRQVGRRKHHLVGKHPGGCRDVGIGELDFGQDFVPLRCGGAEDSWSGQSI